MNWSYIYLQLSFFQESKIFIHEAFQLPLVKSLISYLGKLVRNRAMFARCRYDYWKSHKSSIRSDKNNLSWQHFHPKKKNEISYIWRTSEQKLGH